MAVQVPKMAGQGGSCHHYQLGGDWDLQTVLVALLDLLPCHCDLKNKGVIPVRITKSFKSIPSEARINSHVFSFFRLATQNSSMIDGQILSDAFVKIIVIFIHFFDNYIYSKSVFLLFCFVLLFLTFYLLLIHLFIYLNKRNMILIKHHQSDL